MTIELAPYVGVVLFGFATVVAALGLMQGFFADNELRYSRATYLLAAAIWVMMLAQGLKG